MTLSRGCRWFLGLRSCDSRCPDGCKTASFAAWLIISFKTRTSGKHENKFTIDFLHKFPAHEGRVNPCIIWSTIFFFPISAGTDIRSIRGCLSFHIKLQRMEKKCGKKLIFNQPLRSIIRFSVPKLIQPHAFSYQLIQASSQWLKFTFHWALFMHLLHKICNPFQFFETYSLENWTNRSCFQTFFFQKTNKLFYKHLFQAFLFFPLHEKVNMVFPREYSKEL